MILGVLRSLRHGPLKSLGPLWVLGGKAYRGFVKLAGVQKPITQKIGPYGPFKLHPHFSFSNFENWGGGHNKGFEACIEACRGKQCVLDVGGHIGLVSLPVAGVLGQGGRVIAFEPSAVNHQFLSYHKQVNVLENLEIFQCLVGANAQQAVAFFEDETDNGMNSILYLKDKGKFSKTEREQLTLDGFCADKGLRPEVIKIDVEGAELLVLQGAREVLQQHKPVIFLSVHPRHLEKLGTNPQELLEFAHVVGYEIKDLDGVAVKDFALDEYLMVPRG